ncbi:zinc-ribbon domain-containing protein [Archangium violaceum]|uniref:tetratricopeptide repeat protein n=1 Tax=Archangium violaceum TaxID=83451 RepID=UPI00193BB600|nr:tetratricopeptide repeat protein [Archangium violaceum]QRK08496.1 zinc-ribbon domain-containing protein [Archangium violaceum]
MKVSCPSCQTNYNIDDKRIPPGGAKLKCARCQNTFPIRPAETVSTPAAVPLPGTAAPQSAAIPLPGTAVPRADPYAAYDDFQRPPEAETTRVVSMPLPTAAYRDNVAPPAPAAIPLPGAAAPSADLGEAIPLPGASDPYAGSAYPQSGGTSDGYMGTAGDFDYGGGDPYAATQPPPAGNPYAEDPYAAESQAGAIALPPPPPGAEEPYPYAAEPQAGAIALPPPPAGNPYASASDFGGDAAFGSYQPNTSEVDPFGLPPAPAEDPYAAAPGADDPFGLPPAPAEDPYAAAPGAEDPFALPPAPAEDPFGLPPAPAEDPFAAAPEADDPFALPPVAAAPATVDVGIDFSEPPPAAPMAPASIGGFDDVDFGTPAPSIPDALEFDPSAPAQPGGDDLEADLSAPLPPPPAAGTADGLEMLSFIDDAAKDNGGNKPKANVRRFHVRRRSGKVFGPFEEGVVVKMLEDGQLLGNEDVSTDGDSWAPIGTVSIFASAIQKLMEGPGTPAVPAAAPPIPAESGSKAGQPAATAANMERLNQLYGGRMAQVSVVDSTSRMEIFLGHVKKRLPVVIAAASALAVLGVGFSFSATRYGAFGMKKFFPAQVKPGSQAYADVEAARKALLQDSFQGYKQAHTLTSKVLAGNEYPEVRAIWCQAVFYLQRRYSAANGADLGRCRSEAEMASLELLGEKNVEYTKYLAGNALASRDAGKALQLLQDAWSRESNKGDIELALLLAEAQAAKKDSAKAIDTLNRVLQKKSDLAKAHHALGDLYQAGGKADEAAKAYEAALKADATHIVSAVELASVELMLRKDAQKGLEAAERALDEKQQSQLGPAELSRARTLKGVALFQLARLPEAEQELRAAMDKDSSLLVKSYLARVLYAQRQFKDALPLYEAVAKAEPKNGEATEGYITSLMTLGKLDDAQRVVQEAVKAFPNNARIEYLHGRVDELRDSNISAEEHYTRALKADAEFTEARVALGRFHLRLRRTDQAREQLEAVAVKAPDNALVHVGLGELALAENDDARAREAFERAVALDANLAAAHFGLSQLALRAGDLETAQKQADTALELDPYTLKGARLHRGIVLWRQGKLDEAITELQQAKQEEPRSAGISIALGAVFFDKANAATEDKNPARAINSLKEAEVNLMLALKSEPSNAEANFYMAQVKAAQQKVNPGKTPPGKGGDDAYAEAIDNMKTAVERAPTNAGYHYAFGVIYRDARQLPEAIEQWKEAVKLEPKMADAHEALGRAYLERNEFDQAIAAFQATLKADPKRSHASALIGDAHFSATRWREAARAYEQALKANPSLTAVYYKLGRAWSEQNQYTKAIEWFVKATTATPDNADTWHDLGYAYKEKGKKKDALKAFQEYLTRKPEAENRKEIEDEISFLE